MRKVILTPVLITLCILNIYGQTSFPYKVLTIPALNNSPAYFYLDTNIPASGTAAPQVIITGYTYGAANKAMKITLGWYYWAGNFYWTQYHSDFGYSMPSRIRLGKYLKNGNEFVRIEISNNSVYWSNYTITATDRDESLLSFYQGWTYTEGEFPSGTTTQITNVQQWNGASSLFGQIGIGTASPQSPLDVITPVNGYVSFGNTYSPNQFSGIHFGYRENNTLYRKSALVFERTDNHNQGGNASGKIHFLLRNDAAHSATDLNDAVMTIDSDSYGTRGSVRVGIGTRNPQYRLDVNGGSVRLGNDYSPVMINGVSFRGYPSSSMWLIGNAASTELVLGSNWDWDQSLSVHYTPNSISVGEGRLVIGQLQKNSPNFTHGITSLYTNGVEQFRLDKEGRVGIGTVYPTEKLSVNGNVRARKLIVTQNGWPDYVFSKSYDLMPLDKLEAFVQRNSHLPEIPSAAEVESKGLDMGKTQALLLKKIEEMTLYVLDLQRQIKKQQQEINDLKAKRK